MEVSIPAYIDSQPDKCGGKPCIAGTRIRVQDIYVWHELEGLSPDEIAYQFPELSLTQIHAALAYFHAHREEIQTAVEAEQVLAEALMAQHPSKLLAKLAGKNAPSSFLP